jgi:NAD(P)-dependent dehydrogenase (short-subunit alcohol dehydrogenase family)
VLVTGASSGIGRAAALQVAEAGDHVVLLARGESALAEVAAECLAGGAASAETVVADVGDDAAVAAAFAQTLETHDRIDTVLNCAGVVAYGRTEEVPADVFDAVLRTNLSGAVNVVRHAVPVLRRQEQGSLVLVGSVIGHIAVPGMSPYVLSKWGVRALARQVSLENRDLPHVHVSYLAPGGVDTPIYAQAANYTGLTGRPPPPVASPERVARVALGLVRHPRARVQVGFANDVMRLGFSALPWAFDLLVGPLVQVAAKDRTDPVAPTSGNVLAPNEAGNRVHGDQGNAVLGVARNLRTVVGGLLGAPAER